MAFNTISGASLKTASAPLCLRANTFRVFPLTLSAR
jgi:hypothetical protein